MSENLIPYEATQVVASNRYKVTEKDIDDYLFGTDTKLTDSQKVLFKAVALASNLNPIKREIYAIPYERNVMKNGRWVTETTMAIVTGYQVYLQRAEATGLLGGYKVELTKKDNKIQTAKVIIIRKDWSIPFEWEIEFDEFAKKNKDGELIGSWKTMESFMIKKCALAIGFRLCFPNELGNMPYVAEELSSLTFEELQQKEKEMLDNLAKSSQVKVLMSKETKMELLKLANNDMDVINKALSQIGKSKEDLLESDKQLLETKIKEILNANTTN